MKNWYLAVDITEDGDYRVFSEDEFFEWAKGKAEKNFYQSQTPVFMFPKPIETRVYEIAKDDLDSFHESIKREKLVELGIQKKSSYRKQRWAELLNSDSVKIVHIEK
jgi:hypothetical protein